MKRFIFLMLCICLFFLFLPDNHAQNQWSSEYVYYGDGGKLTYTPDESGNIIPDFSHVGYMYGDEPIPDIPVAVEVEPVDGDDGPAIQAAIESLYGLSPDENGFRGAVLLKKGIYQVSGSIFINQGGIVLRGEGEGEDGTVIIATGTVNRPLIKVANATSLSLDYGSVQDITESYVPVGRKYVIVQDASGFSSGDKISLYRPGTQSWISDLKMDQIPGDGGEVTQWTPSSYSFNFERLVTKVSGDTLFFRNPVVMAMETKYGGGKVYKCSQPRLNKIGVENMLLKSEYASNTDENHSWNAIIFNGVENGWARNITSKYFAYACVNLERSSRLITVENCTCLEPKSLITGSRRYSFNCVGQLNLFKNCHASEGRHDYVTSSRVTGPNVFLNSTARNAFSDIGPHHRWAMGTLYDNIDSDGSINVQDRGSMGSGHGWAGANQVFWNCVAASSICQNPYVSANNYNFGFIGQKMPGAYTPRPDGIWEGHNRPGLYPGSLYEAQLDERLNNTIRFSVFPKLTPLSDSSFSLKFNLPVNRELAGDIAHYILGGTSGIEDRDFSVSVVNDYEIKITIHELGIINAFSTIELTVIGVTSADGLALNGLATSFYIEPDKRPVVTASYQEVGNSHNDFVVAASSKTGSIYLVYIGVSVSNVADLIAAEEQGKAISVEVTREGSYRPLYTLGLSAGTYYFYAVDDDGRVSARGEGYVKINSTWTGIAKQEIAGIKVFSAEKRLFVEPSNDDAYHLKVYSITGQVLLEAAGRVGRSEWYINHPSGICIVQVISGGRIMTKKLIIR